MKKSKCTDIRSFFGRAASEQREVNVSQLGEPNCSNSINNELLSSLPGDTTTNSCATGSIGTADAEQLVQTGTIVNVHCESKNGSEPGNGFETDIISLPDSPNQPDPSYTMVQTVTDKNSTKKLSVIFFCYIGVANTFFAKYLL